MNDRVISSRITEARESRAMSMEDLANHIGVSRQAVSKYEKGIIFPSPEILSSISHTLSIPIEFFYKNEYISNAESSALFFRSKSNIAKKVKVACKYQVKWTNEIKKQLERYVDFIEQDVPVIDTNYEDLTEAEIEELALTVRKQWELGDQPINDLIGILENKGIIVAKFAPNDLCRFKGIDAFSAWEDGTPYILYNPIQKSAVRTRFSILHELGHLIMHNSIAEHESIKREIVDFADRQADRFAAAFLLPATSFPNDVKDTSLISLKRTKQKWKAAMSTIIKRCEDLNLLTENQLNYLKRQMTTKKYWHKEPLDDVLTVAAPEVLHDAIIMLINSNLITKYDFFYTSGLSAADLSDICGLPSDFFDIYQRNKPVLKLVKNM